MKRIMLAVLLSIMSLVLANSALGATTATGTAQASVTVNTFVDITVVQCPVSGVFNFGSQDPGVTDVPIACQTDANTALRTIVEATTNKPVNITLIGTNYAGPGNPIAVENTKYNFQNLTVNSTSFPVAAGPAVNAFTSVGGAGIAVNNDLWFWLSVPSSFLTAGAYTSTYTLSAS
jgi:hypothetical protein